MQRLNGERSVALAGLAILIAGCGGEAPEMRWTVRYESPGTAEGVQFVEGVVRAGGCDGEIVQARRVGRMSTGGASSLLDAGIYGFEARAWGEDCRWVARGCVEATLPEDTDVVVELAEVDDAPLCDASACEAGQCDGMNPDGGPVAVDGGPVDGGFDGGPIPGDGGGIDPDAGAPDAGAPDAGSDAGSPPPPAVAVRSVQRDVINGLTGTKGTATVDAVDPSRSLLLTTVASDSLDPVNTLVRGTLADSTTVEFYRDGAGEGEPRVAWQLIEFERGVRVIRGVEAMGGSSSHTITLPEAVDRSRSFVVISVEKRGSYDHDDNDYTRAELVADDQLEITVGGGDVACVLDWQVVTLDAGEVEYGNIHLSVNEIDDTASLGTANPERATLFATYSSPGDFNAIGARSIRGRIVDDQVIFDRQRDEVEVDISWFAVVWPPGVEVLRGAKGMGDTQLVANVSVDGVQASRSFAFLSPGLHVGSTDNVGDTESNAYPGVAWSTVELSDGNIRLERKRHDDDNARFAWTVVSLPSP